MFSLPQGRNVLYLTIYLNGVRDCVSYERTCVIYELLHPVETLDNIKFLEVLWLSNLDFLWWFIQEEFFMIFDHTII